MRDTVVLYLLASLSLGIVLPARAASTDAATSEQAQQHFLRGQQLFDVARWEEAALEFEQAYAAHNDPIFIYHMAQAYRHKGDARRALDLYKNFLTKAPECLQRAEVEERISTLQKQLGEADSKPATSAQPVLTQRLDPEPEQPATPAQIAPLASVPMPAPAPVPAYVPAAAPAVVSQPTAAQVLVAPVPPAEARAISATPIPSSSPGRGLRIAGLVSGGVGLGALVCAVVFGQQAGAYSSSVETRAVYNPYYADRGKLYETLQWVSYGVGGGLVATGAVLYWLGASSQPASGVALAPATFPNGAGLSAQGVF